MAAVSGATPKIMNAIATITSSTLKQFCSRDAQAEPRSQAIDRALEEEAELRKIQYNVLPLGAFPMREIVQQLQNKTEVDTLQSHKGVQGVSEHRFVTNGLSLNLIDVGTQRCERRKWIHQFDNVAAILHVVDLPCYDQELSTGNAMVHQIQLFESVVNAEIFENSTFILFLSNVSLFRQKLAHRALGNYFSDYSGGSSVEKAEEYVRQRFRRVSHGRRKLYVYFVDPYEVSNVQLVSAAILDAVHLISKADVP